eukprot:Rhum_TRINITY_DN15428_c7_g2::Rhum_TRINITY_DN15428_c7_g2_i3::g.155802::m.155802
MVVVGSGRARGGEARTKLRAGARGCSACVCGTHSGYSLCAFPVLFFSSSSTQLPSLWFGGSLLLCVFDNSRLMRRKATGGGEVQRTRERRRSTLQNLGQARMSVRALAPAARMTLVGREATLRGRLTSGPGTVLLLRRGEGGAPRQHVVLAGSAGRVVANLNQVGVSGVLRRKLLNPHGLTSLQLVNLERCERDVVAVSAALFQLQLHAVRALPLVGEDGLDLRHVLAHDELRHRLHLLPRSAALLVDRHDGVPLTHLADALNVREDDPVTGRLDLTRLALTVEDVRLPARGVGGVLRLDTREELGGCDEVVLARAANVRLVTSVSSLRDLGKPSVSGLKVLDVVRVPLGQGRRVDDLEGDGVRPPLLPALLVHTIFVREVHALGTRSGPADVVGCPSRVRLALELLALHRLADVLPGLVILRQASCLDAQLGARLLRRHPLVSSPRGEHVVVERTLLLRLTHGVLLKHAVVPAVERSVKRLLAVVGGARGSKRVVHEVAIRSVEAGHASHELVHVLPRRLAHGPRVRRLVISDGDGVHVEEGTTGGAELFPRHRLAGTHLHVQVLPHPEARRRHVFSDVHALDAVEVLRQTRLERRPVVACPHVTERSRQIRKVFSRQLLPVVHQE